MELEAGREALTLGVGLHRSPEGWLVEMRSGIDGHTPLECVVPGNGNDSTLNTPGSPIDEPKAADVPRTCSERALRTTT